MEYTLKQIPQDFIVTEVQDAHPLVPQGNYFFVWMKKQNMSTLQALSYVTRTLRINEKEIGSAGYKDKQAITEQGITIPKKGFTTEQIEAITLNETRQLHLTVRGMTDHALYPGCHQGNRFHIRIRNVKEPIDITNRFVSNHLCNYFGEQRFSAHNLEYGRLILKQSFKEVVEMILSNEEDTSVGKDLRTYLSTHPDDYVGALRFMNKKVLQLYIQAYQSYLWNKIVSCYTTHNTAQEKELFLPGYGMPTYSDTTLNTCILNVFTEETITKRDFFIRSFPELSQKGSLRPIMMPITEFKAEEWHSDTLNDNKYEILVSFRLEKGAYATEVIRQLLS